MPVGGKHVLYRQLTGPVKCRRRPPKASLSEKALGGVLCVLEKFEEFCRDAGVEMSANQFNTLAVGAAYHWVSTNRYPKAEKQAFRNQVIKIMASHDSHPAKGSDRVQRIIDATGKKPRDDVLVKLIMVTQNPITRLEPVFFAERFKQLTDKQ